MKAVITKILALLLVLILAAGIAACANTSNNVSSSVTSSTTIIKKDFSVIQDESDLPEEVQDAINKLKDKKGYIWFKDGDEYIIVIFSGEKNTGGYGIAVTDVSEIDGVIRITVEETAPGKDDMVIMVITYPWVAISIESKTEDFRVQDKDGEVFEKLEYDRDSENTPAEITVKAEYVGEIDGSSIAANVDGEEMAFRHEKVQELMDVVDVLKPGDAIMLVYHTNEYGQNIIIKIELAN